MLNKDQNAIAKLKKNIAGGGGELEDFWKYYSTFQIFEKKAREMF